MGFAYGEASLPLVGPANARPGLHLLHLNGAVRYEHYSAIGDVAVPRLSARLDPVQGFSLRVGWGRSFKVPTLFQIGQAPQGTLLPASYFRPPPPGGRPVLLLSGGGRELAPERAQTWTAGVVLAPLPSEDLRLEITYYHLSYQDRVLRPVPNDIVVFGSTAFADLVTQRSAAEIAALVSALPQGLANQTGAPFNPATVEAVIDNRLQNLARQRVEGIDIAVHAATPAGRGSRLLFDAGLSYLDSDQQASAGQPVVQRAGTIFDPPHWRGRASLGWERGGLGLTGAATYIGGVRDDRFQPATVVDSFLAVDLTARLHSPASRGPLAGATLFLSALNLLDQAPGRIRTTSAANPPFDTTNYPAIGRVLSLTVSKAW